MFFYRKLLYNFDMLRELQILAKMAKDDDREPSERVTKLMAGASQGMRGMGPVEIGSLATIPLAPAIRALVNSAKGFDPASIPQTPDELRALVSKLEQGQKLSPHIRLMIADRPGQAQYGRTMPWKKFQKEVIKVAPKSNPQTIAHEFGHAIQPNKLEKYLNIAALLSKHPAATALPSIMALSGGLSSDEKTPVYAKAAPYVGGAQLAAILGEETRANIRALKLLKEKGIPITALQKLRQFVPSLSYLGRASLLVGAPLGVLKGLELYEKSRKTDHPMTFDQMTRMSPETAAETPSPEDFQKKWEPRLKK
jgi:hypothetical protein